MRPDFFFLQKKKNHIYGQRAAGQALYCVSEVPAPPLQTQMQISKQDR